MKRIFIRNFIAGFLAVILIIAAAVPARADDVLEGAAGAEEVGLTAGVDFPKDNGNCGDNCKYSFDKKKGVLTISGTGATWDYCHGFYVDGDTYTIKINSGITELGKVFFCNDPDYWWGQFYPEKLVNVILPKSLKKIGEENFDVEYFPKFVFYEGTWSDWNKIDRNTSTNDFANRVVLCKGEWFTDVTEGKKFFFEPVYWAVGRGITSGHGPGTFQPYEACTRAMIVTFLWNYAGQPKVPGTTAFSDVKPSDWFYQAVSWAVREGITSGHGPGTFKPNETCTRAMIVTFLKNYMGKYATVQYQPLFPDVKNSDWFGPAVIWAYENGITSGKGGYFKPNDPCTRGEAVTFLYNAYMSD